MHEKTTGFTWPISNGSRDISVVGISLSVYKCGRDWVIYTCQFYMNGSFLTFSECFQLFFRIWILISPLYHTDLKWQIWRNNCFNGKTCKFDSDISDFNSVDLKKTKKIIKGQIFFQRPNLKAKGQKFQILWFFQWFGLVCKQLFRKSHWCK